MGNTPFKQLCDLLISTKKTFDEDSLQQLTYDDLMLASCANAFGAICEIKTTNAEMERRLRDVLDNLIEKYREVSESDQMCYDLFCRKADKDNLEINWKDASCWLHLYHTLKAFYLLPSTIMFWDKKIIPGKGENIETNLYHLLQEQIPETAQENVVPSGWAKAVEQNLGDYFKNENISSSIVVHGRTKFKLELVDGFEGSTQELFYKLLTPDQQLQIATRFTNGPELVMYRRYFLAEHPLKAKSA